MQRCSLLSYIFLVLFGTSVASCKKDSEPSPSGLVGNWKLVSWSCECEPTLNPNERASFTSTNFLFYKDDQLISEGAYTNTTAQVDCGSTRLVPVLRLTNTTGTVYQVVATVSSKTLVLDYRASYGNCVADAPIAMYERLP
jgi:hypothetical protein